MEKNEGFVPKVIAFCCNWCSYAGADLAGTSRLSYPPNVKIIKVPCSCRVDPIFVLRAFGKGADGVLVCGCHPGDCHYSTGNYHAQARFEKLFALLDFIGIERERMRLEWISAAESVKFAQVMNEFTQRITELGANRRLVDIRNITDAEEKMSASGSATTPVGANCVRPPHYADVAQTEEQMRKRAIELLNSGEVNRILAWKKGDFEYYPEPSFFTTAEEIEQDFVYNRFCAANLTKYLMAAPWLGGRQFEGKTAIFLKPCDSHSFNRLLEENLANREKTHIIGVACGGNVYVEEMEEIGLLEKCQVCEKTEHAVFDEVIGEVSRNPSKDRMEMVDALDAMTGEERFAFWQEQLSKCIRCNACRNTCPVCNCKKCVFSGDNYDMVSKVNTTEFEGQMFHAVRAFHVAGRCSDCGECSRTCPQDIPIHLLNRKLIKVDMQKGE